MKSHSWTDEQLMQNWGKWLSSDKTTPMKSEDPLFKALAQFKKEETKPLGHHPERLWESISASIHTSSSAPITPLSWAYRWAVAAMLFIGLTSIAWLIFQPNTSRLLVEASSHKVEYTLEDGSVVLLRPFSALYEISIDEKNHVYELEGEAQFSVTKKPSRRFTVKAGSVDISVLGTVFTVQKQPDNVVVYLEEGSIQLQAESLSKRLSPGDIAQVVSTENGFILNDHGFSPEELTDWIQNEISFNEQPVEEVLSEIERHFGIHISINPTLKRARISGAIELSSPDSTLFAIAEVLGLSVRSPEANQYVLE